ncbi:helix-turn-helix domain-containing protein [Eisenibacter elegans]|jgi:AraC-like DNA-binding protein|uniref:helix-turn-helix domain-containing protein n=1 Tax=Eisenibacter elegans TaxID=997 RepID=UPI0003FD863C|nr:helix-turn-helix transcriptional regulator [Eisenibacter elegans]
MPPQHVLTFSDFDALHQTIGSKVRSTHQEVQVFRYEDIGERVLPRMPLFRTNFYQIGLMRRANFRLHIYEQEYALNRQCAVVMFKPGQLIQFESDPAWEGYVLLFRDSFVSAVVGSEQSAGLAFSVLDPCTPSFAPVTEAVFAELAQVYEQMIAAYEQSAPEALTVLSLYIQILLHKLEPRWHKSPTLSTAFSARKTHLVYQFKQLIPQYIQQTRKVEDYAAMLHISPKYLVELVSAITGKPPKAHLQDMLVSELKTVLRHSQTSMGQLAAAYHFKDQAQLSHFFKKNTGRNPLDYRNEHTTGHFWKSSS